MKYTIALIIAAAFLGCAPSARESTSASETSAQASAEDGQPAPKSPIAEEPRLDVDCSWYEWLVALPVLSDPADPKSEFTKTGNALYIIEESGIENVYKILVDNKIGYVDLGVITNEAILASPSSFRDYRYECELYAKYPNVRRIGPKLLIKRGDRTLVFKNTFAELTQRRYRLSGFLNDRVALIGESGFEGGRDFLFDLDTGNELCDADSLPNWNGGKTFFITYGTNYVQPAYSIFRMNGDLPVRIFYSRIEVDGSFPEMSINDTIKWISDNEVEIQLDSTGETISISASRNWAYAIRRGP